MKIVGLITEYNPFHNGHLYHIEQAKKVSGADYAVVIMSGNFVQRGAPAFMPKHLRAAIALNSGADLLLELPVCYATGSAEYFASGAISILDNLGCIDSICFGSEYGDYNTLEKISHVIADEPDEYKTALQSYLKQGISFPVARQNALNAYFNDDKLDAILEHPNNILGIEYMKALYKRKSSIKGYTIQRISSNYHDMELKEHYSSASSLRKALLEMKQPNEILQFENQMTDFGVLLLKDNYLKKFPVISNDLSLLLRCRLFTETVDSLCGYMDINPELAHRIINTRNEFMNFEQYCELLKTRELTYSRISRALLHILLDIKSIDINGQYARLLGFRKEADVILSMIKKYASIPLITKLSKTENLTEKGQKMLEQDISASNLYENIISHKFNQPFIHEFKQQIIIQ